MVRILAKYLLFVFLSLSYSSYARGQTTAPSEALGYVEGEVIVKMKGTRAGVQSSSFASKASQKGMSLKTSWGRMGMYHYKVRPGQKTSEAVAELRNDPEVEYAEPNYIYAKSNVSGFSDVISNEEMVSMSSGSYMATGAPIQVVDSWSEVGGTGVPVIAVIDTGLDTTHSVITSTNALWINTNEVAGNGIDDDGNGYIDDVNGWNFVSASGNVFDDNGHGTHVAGIILGVGVNIYEAFPDASRVKIMPLKFLNGSGQGKTSDAIKAIYYAVDNGAQVLNNSWGGYSYSAALHEAIAYSYNQGTAFIAASGNDAGNNDSSPMYPASYNVPNVISVAATTDSDILASFSNYGRSSVDLAGPGVRIYSTYPGNSFGISSGTSMATPFVAGLAGLILVEKPTMQGFQVRDIILGNTDSIAGLASKVATQGRMNALDTVHAAQVASVDNSTPTYSYSNQDRALASAIASGGCGTVSTMGNGSGGWPSFGAPGTEAWSLFVIIGLFMLPVMIHFYLRSKHPESRRKHDRYKIDTEVKVQLGDRQLVASISTISLGGVQLNTNALLEQGGIVKMSISSPDGKDQIEVDGRVVWSEANRAYGVKFEEAKETALQKIGGWTRALTKT